MSPACTICGPAKRRCPALAVKNWPCCGAPLTGRHATSCRQSARLKALARLLKSPPPAGHEVIVARDTGDVVHTRTRSGAWLLGDGSPVVLLEGFVGGFALERVKLVRQRRVLSRVAVQGDLWPSGEADADGGRQRFRRRAWEQLRAPRGRHVCGERRRAA